MGDTKTMKVDAAHHRWLWAALFAAYVLIPVLVTQDFWLKILIYAGITAIGAIGLNLLTGNTGQLSLGHPFFMGIGAYTAGFVGQNMGLPFPLWMAAAIVVPALFGAIVAQFALRLRGHYLVIVTFSLVLIGQHVFKNWTAVTNGAAGRPIQIGLDIFGWDVTRLQAISRDKVYFLVIWAFVAIIAYLTHNLVRSRVGRALMAVRDREITADVIGIDITYYKIAAFTISSGIGGVAGAFYGAFVQYTNPAEWSILLGVQYLAVIVVGGIGSVAGSIIGALVITILPYGVEVFSPYVPLIARNPGDPGIITLFALNQVLFGSVIILFLIFAPRGLADLLRRAVRRVAVRQ